MTGYRRLAMTTAAPRRPYSISVGLQEGFDDQGVVHDISDAQRVVLAWIKERIEAGEVFLSGTLGQQTVLYGIGTRECAQTKSEPAAVFSGAVSVRRVPVPSDEEVEDMLDDLAARLGAALGQVRVNIEYCGAAWVIEAEGVTLPQEPHQ